MLGAVLGAVLCAALSWKVFLFLYSFWNVCGIVFAVVNNLTEYEEGFRLQSCSCSSFCHDWLMVAGGSGGGRGGRGGGIL